MIPLYTSPWVTHTIAAKYFGSVAAEGDELEATLEILAATAEALGANTVVGFEPTFDLSSMRWRVVGTAALLEPMP